ncbi:hypothetical protein GCM10011571_17250 [Marinithermofilum abyssi]|uniref:Uncharacterized protein n=1 Tax=Marinithermofilum abyssi TaxID=1571185 RepID=A0A8J2YAM1_9BACL|nr:replication-relaxation family protein [Marinithermofilum abyssi]GGE16161.1 hypothetical protein GCM10011571_17250 [Marinithermofilum abyssi]
MNLIECLMHPFLKRSEEMLANIYKLRMIAAHQLAEIMDVSENYIFELKRDLNKKGEMVISHQPDRRRRGRLPYPDYYKVGPRMYELGPAGKAVVEDILGYPIHYKRLTGVQRTHYYGVNDILVRTLRRLTAEEEVRLPEDRKQMARMQVLERLGWWNQGETAQILLASWRPKLEKKYGKGKEKERLERQSKLAYPDARIEIDGKGFWLEYDNQTETIKNNKRRDPYKKITTIEDKMVRYIETMGPIQNKEPIIWVTPSTVRRDNIQKCWDKIKKSSKVQQIQLQAKDLFFYPEMHFCTLGEEQQMLC